MKLSPGGFVLVVLMLSACAPAATGPVATGPEVYPGDPCNGVVPQLCPR
ncbi:hypothetical protein OCGS_0522 [Oceaniovalibus guishaninsula JLT2003]|uniref:Lipoprotein n=1 Tax=Oceaniovalibus guishaninsula JLT2003 TaxID=1231392 RepID=K2HG36_9RHOB|nr:hypothetical protein [Oceaniovalibus guishaninsula]EKE45432.1 hypothetical protein OCGS_0522 [Oceaniovalibus guishaninsula JLT2003]